MLHNYFFRTFLLGIFLFSLGQTQVAAQNCGNFYDGFETGVLSPVWQFGTAVYTRTIMSTGAPVGNYYFNHSSTASSSFYQGTYATWTPAQPTYFSWWMRTNTTTAANGYVVIGNSNISSDNGILFCYFNSTSQLRFFNTAGQNYNITANTWYHVEAKNVNWTTRTMDIWINNAVYLTNWAFRSTTAMDCDRVHLANLSAASPDYDDFKIGLPGLQLTNSIVTDPLCFGDTSGMIDLTATTPNGAISYVWSNGATTEDILNVSPGSYSVTISDSLGCLINETFTLNSPTAIATSSQITPVQCPGGNSGSIDLSTVGGSPSYTYLWNNGATTEDLSALQAGIYSVVVTDTNGCQTADTLTVTEPSAFAASAIPTSPTCATNIDGALDLSVTGGTPGYTYLWTTGASTQDLTGIGSGTYSVLITDSQGCFFQDSFLVAPGAAILPNATVLSPTCFGFGNGSISLNPSGGTPNYTYGWSTGGGASSINVSAGTYFSTVTDANGCFVVDTIVIVAPAELTQTGTSNDDTGSGNGSISLTTNGGTAPYSYLWSNGSTLEDPNSLVAGTYTVTITDANGCTSNGTYVVDLVISALDAQGVRILAWPNPFENQLIVSVEGLRNDGLSLQLVDLTGRILWKMEFQNDMQIPLTLDLPSGIYLLQMQSSTGLKTSQKLVRQ